MKLKKAFLSLLLIFTCIPNALAYSDYIIAGGKNIGIELSSKGVIVVGFYKVEEEYIGSKAGLEVGDIITTINDANIKNITELTNKINTSSGNIKIGYMRNDISKYTNLKLNKDISNTYKTGIYVKDTISGIGTLTYIDPNNKVFGALGHEITESNTGKILSIDNGNIFNSHVTNVEPSTNGSPGEKNATVYSNESLGNIKENTNKGIFGNFTDEINTNRLYKVGKPDEIKKGRATILTVLDGTKVNEYTINILKVETNNDTKNILFEIDDKTLLSKTNGIIQGMSGSPIIQNDKIIGAVTHVIVDNPHKGYGILITNMLEEGEN